MKSSAAASALLAGLWAAGASAQPAQPALARLLAPQSEVVFVTRQMGVPVDGRFKRFDAQVRFDPKRPESGSVAIDIDVASASMGIAEVDAEMPKPTWFNAAKFAQARFQSSTIRALGAGRFEVAGRLSIKGTTSDLVLPVAITQSGADSTVSGSFMLKRLEFKIGEAEWADTTVVANDVKVQFKLVFNGLGAL
jgi:polyisoprenoid-binding protein YceI